MNSETTQSNKYILDTNFYIQSEWHFPYRFVETFLPVCTKETSSSFTNSTYCFIMCIHCSQYLGSDCLVFY